MTQMSMPFGHSTSAVLLVEVVMMIQEDEDKDEDKKNDRKEKNKKKLVMHQHLTVPTQNDTEG